MEKYMPLVLLNPRKGQESENEDCLSFLEMSAEITRVSGVRCKASTLDGKIPRRPLHRTHERRRQSRPRR
jgi:peptide deformylase